MSGSAHGQSGVSASANTRGGTAFRAVGGRHAGAYRRYEPSDRRGKRADDGERDRGRSPLRGGSPGAAVERRRRRRRRQRNDNVRRRVAAEERRGRTKRRRNGRRARRSGVPGARRDFPARVRANVPVGGARVDGRTTGRAVARDGRLPRAQRSWGTHLCRGFSVKRKIEIGCNFFTKHRNPLILFS